MISIIIGVVLTLAWLIFLIWPQTDGGGVPFSPIQMGLPAWFMLGPLAAIWIAVALVQIFL